jgi:glycosyltransferase involved in cell wall biosynthesis
MRFLMLNWRDPGNPRAGGAERVTQGYLAALAERGHEVYWYSYQFEGAAAEEDMGPIRIVRGGGAGTAVLEAIAWYRSQPAFDLVIDQHHGIPWYAPWWCGTRCVAYIHEVLGPIWESFYPWPLSLIGQLQERWTHWLYRAVPFWTASRFTRLLLRRNGVRQVHLIPYGVETVALAELGPKPLVQPLRLITVSRLAPNKRVDHALRLVRCLLDRGINVRLSVVGAGEVEESLRGLARALGLDECVTFTGALSEAAKDGMLKDSHFLIHTSLREGWGLNVIEANALGTPAAVYPVAGLTESTIHGRTGLVARAERPECLAESLVGILQDGNRYEQLRKRAWERAGTFHWSRVLPRACDWLEGQAMGSPAAMQGDTERVLRTGRPCAY